MNGTRLKSLLTLIPWLLSGPFFYLLFRLSFLWPDFIESIYSRGIFRFVNQGLSSFTGIFSFSIAEMLLYSFILFVAAFVLFALIRAGFAKRKWWFVLLKRLIILLCVFSCVYALFVGLWGFNYARKSLGHSLGLDTSPASLNELYSVCETLTQRANALRLEVREDSSGVYCPDLTKTDIMNNTSYYYDRAAQQTGDDYLAGSYGRTKPVLYSSGLSYANITGVYFPFTGEANINADMPLLFFPASCLHESAHQRGFAREDEANFLAFYVSMYSGDVSVEYSGVMLALIETMNRLYEQDTDLYFSLRANYSEGVVRDLKQNSDYWRSFESPVCETSKAVNNAFLKANNQSDGVKSYGRMADLIIGLWRKGGLAAK